MRVQRGMRNAAELVVVDAEIADRVDLETTPDRAAVRDYVLTRRAERAWSALNQQLASERGALLWITGPTGAGKTHFLNYALALSERAAAGGASRGRRLTIAIPLSATPAAELEQVLATRIARAVAGGGDAAAVWRNLQGLDILRVVLDQAKRRGVAAITLALDFGELEAADSGPRLQGLAELARTFAHPHLVVIAAGRAAPPASVATFAVGPAPDELVPIAIARARRLAPAAGEACDAAYDALDLDELQGDSIYPFHPAAARALVELGGDRGSSRRLRASPRPRSSPGASPPRGPA